MNKKITSLLMAVVMLFSVVFPGAMSASAETAAIDETVAADETPATQETVAEETVAPEKNGFSASRDCIAILKAEEGFSQKPYWDYMQYTVGYGTRCPDDKLAYYNEYGITEAEAEALLQVYLDRFAESINVDFIQKHGLTLNQNQFDALMLLSYNCGTNWIYSDTNSNLRKSIIAGATGSEIVDRFSRWCNAGGQIKTYLLRRRLCEANIYLNGVYSQVIPDNFGYVLYDANGGTSPVTVQGFDTVLTAAIIPTPTRDGYTFDGWYTSKTEGEKITVLDGKVRNTRLYARWLDGAGTNPDVEAEASGIKVTVDTYELLIRQGPGTNYSIVGSFFDGEQVTITKTESGSGYIWGQCSKGWICLKYTNYNQVVEDEKEDTVETPAAPVSKMGTVKVSSYLCVRSGPSTGYSVVSKLYNGTRVEILEQKIAGSMVWGKIASGWISMDYVVLDPESAPPAEEPAPTEPAPTEPAPTEPAPTEPAPTEPAPSEPSSTVRTGKVKVKSVLIVRSGPDTSYKAVTTLANNTSVTITEQTTTGSMTWGKISSGWICMDYVVLDAVSGTTTESVMGTVNVSSYLRVRSQAGTSYTIVGYLYPKNRVEILEKKTVGNTVWGRISNGWIDLSYVILDGQSSAPSTPSVSQGQTKTVNTACLRVRSQAGTSSSIVGYLYSGAKVTVYETTTVGGSTWGRISNGWICLDYVK